MRTPDHEQYSLGDAWVKTKPELTRWLDDIRGLIDWGPIGQILSEVHRGDVGAPSYPVLPMFRLLLLQQWHGLSDPQAEAAVNDRYSFRRFCGFPMDQDTPDHVTIWRFREALGRLGLAAKALAGLNAQLDRAGLFVKKGTLIDATIIPAAVRPPRSAEGEVTERDPQAGFTVKNGESHFGYKGHVAVDEGSGLLRQIETSSADLHDSMMGRTLVQGDEERVYADKAYDSEGFRADLKAAGIEPCVLHKARRNKALKAWQEQLNRLWSAVRSGVERAFATMKEGYGLRRARYIGLARNDCHLQLIGFAMNLKRARVLILE